MYHLYFSVKFFCHGTENVKIIIIKKHNLHVMLKKLLRGHDRNIV